MSNDVANRRNKYKNNPMNATTNNTDNVSAGMDDKDKFNIQFDTFSLNLFISLVINSDTNVSKTDLNNLYTLMERVNVERYKNDPEKYTKLRVIRLGIEARISHSITNKYVLVDYIYRKMPISDFEITKDTLMNMPKLNTAEIDQVTADISNKLRVMYLVKESEEVLNFSASLASGDYRDPEGMIANFTSCLEGLLVKLRRAKRQASDIVTFSLEDDILRSIVYETHDIVSSPSNRLKCGMRAFNMMLNGGFENTRVNMLFGIAGGGKSILLLNLAMQIKKNNNGYVCKDPSKRPAVVLLIQENTVSETVERLFAMCATDMDGMTARSKEECLAILKNRGMMLSAESPIDLIIRYVPNSTVNTGYLYDLYDELIENGIEPICLVHDYLKCIRAADDRAGNDPRLELGYITKEYKRFTNEKLIPLIGASQLNRESIRSIDEAIRVGKEDRFKDVTSAQIGESMLIFENIDFAAVIGIEDYTASIDTDATPNYIEDPKDIVYQDKGKHLCCKRIKSRGLSSTFDYFVIPFDPLNKARLMEDELGDYDELFFTVRDSKDFYCKMMETGSYSKLVDARNKEPIVNTIKYRSEDETRLIKGDYTNAANMIMSRLYRGYTSGKESTTKREYTNIYIKLKSQSRIQAINKDHTKVDYILGSENIDNISDITYNSETVKMDTSDYSVDPDFNDNEPLMAYHESIKQQRLELIKQACKIQDSKERDMRLNLPRQRNRMWHLYFLQHRAMMQNTYLYNAVRFSLPSQQYCGISNTQYIDSVHIQDYASQANLLADALITDINNGSAEYDRIINHNVIPNTSQQWFDKMPVTIADSIDNSYNPLDRFVHEYRLPNSDSIKEYFAVMPTHQEFYEIHFKLHNKCGGNIYLLTPYEKEAYQLYRCREVVENYYRMQNIARKEANKELDDYSNAYYYLICNMNQLAMENVYDAQFYSSFFATAYTGGYTDFESKNSNVNADIFQDKASKRINSKEVPKELLPRNKEVLINKLQDDFHASIAPYIRTCKIKN